MIILITILLAIIAFGVAPDLMTGLVTVVLCIGAFCLFAAFVLVCIAVL